MTEKFNPEYLLQELKKLIIQEKIEIITKCSKHESIYFCIGITGTPTNEVAKTSFKECVGCPVGALFYNIALIPTIEKGYEQK